MKNNTLLWTLRTKFSWLGWAVLPIVLVGAAVIVALVFPAIARRGLFVLLIGAVAASATSRGWKGATFAIVLSAFAGAWFLEPIHSFRLSGVWEWVRLCILVVTATTISWLFVSRDRVRDMLVRNEQRLMLALDAAGLGTWERNLETGAFWWSDGLVNVLGRTPEVDAESYDAFYGQIHADDGQRLEKALRRSLTDGLDFEIEQRLMNEDGSVRWLNTRGRVLYDGAGVPQRVLAVAQNVTARKIAEASDPL